MTDVSLGRTRTLGLGGPPISPLGLGTWAIGGRWIRGWGEQDDADSIATIHRAVGLGVNWIDTAPVYGRGHSEEVVGRAVAQLPVNDRPLIATKCGRVETPDGLRSIGAPASLRRECETSLARLGTDVLDLLQLHWPPDDGTSLEESWACLAELRDAGTIRWAGVSNVSAVQLQRLEQIAHVDTVQPPLSLIKRGALNELLPWCDTYRVAAIVYAPMQAGLLTGAFDAARVRDLDPEDWRRSDPEFTEPGLGRNLRLVERLRPIARELQATLAELAIAWTLVQPAVAGAIVGARRPDQVDAWVGAGTLSLTPEVRAAIDDAVRAELRSAR